MSKITEVKISEPDFKIDIADDIVSLGSCFSDEISKYLLKRSFVICSNPFGTMYNCRSIFRTLELISGCKYFSKDDLINEDGRLISFDHSTLFDSPDSSVVLDRINGSIKNNSSLFKNAGVFIITPGTSFVYHYKKDGRIAANCHKLPGGLFERRMMSVDENTDVLKKIISLIKENNPAAKIVFTLSPIRHTPHDPVENSLSKSILRAALSNVLNNTDLVYFPSFEILFDEMRNYSHYRSDGVHLKKKTVNVIAGRFVNSFFDKDMLAFMKEFESCLKLLSHRPKDPGAAVHAIVLCKNLARLISLYNLKKSPIIEKHIIIFAKRIIKSGGVVHDKDICQLPDGKFKKFMTFLVNDGNSISMNLNDLDYENIYYKKLNKLKRKLTAKHHYDKGEYEMSSKILLKE